MKLLILTQKVDKNSNALSFFLSWIEEFSRQFSTVTIICLYEGEHNLPENVNVLSLGKEAGKSKIIYVYRFYKYIVQERNNYDAVFVHMNQIYAIMGWPVWKALNKKKSLWFAHGSVSFSLKLAIKMVDMVFTSTKEGCRVNSNKIQIIGQGIDIGKFIKNKESHDLKNNSNEFRILSVGRISRIKKLEILIKSIELVLKNHKDLKFKVDIVGGVEYDKDREYEQELKGIVESKRLGEMVRFLGPTTHDDVIKYFNSANLYVHTGNTGSLDKVVLEAMVCACPVISCNDATRTLFASHKNELLYGEDNFLELADRINKIVAMDRIQRQNIGLHLKKIVIDNHSLKNLIGKIKYALSNS